MAFLELLRSGFRTGEGDLFGDGFRRFEEFEGFRTGSGLAERFFGLSVIKMVFITYKSKVSLQRR